MGDDFALQGTSSSNTWTYFWLSHGGRGLLASNGWKPGILLNLLQCTEQFPMTKSYAAQTLNTAGAEKPGSTPWGGVALFPLNSTPFAKIFPYLPTEKRAILQQVSAIPQGRCYHTVTTDAPNPSADLQFTVCNNNF